MDELFELGLTRNEAKAYEVLINSGKLSASEISTQGMVPYSRVYDVLSSLIQKGLVRIIPEKTKKFSPSDPRALMGILKNKEKALADVKKKIMKMQKTFYTKEKNPVIMGIGRRAFYKIVEEMSEPRKFDYNIKWRSEFTERWVGITERALKRGCEVKSLVRFDGETKRNVRKWQSIFKDTRKLDNEGVAISVLDNEVMIAL